MHGNFAHTIMEIGLLAMRLPKSSPDRVHNACAQPWSSSFFEWLETATWSTLFTASVTDYLDWATDASSTFVTRFNADILNEPHLDVPGSYFPFTASPPYCGRCSFSIGDAQVYRWPLSDQPPAVSTLILKLEIHCKQFLSYPP